MKNLPVWGSRDPSWSVRSRTHYRGTRAKSCNPRFQGGNKFTACQNLGPPEVDSELPGLEQICKMARLLGAQNFGSPFSAFCPRRIFGSRLLVKEGPRETPAAFFFGGDGVSPMDQPLLKLLGCGTDRTTMIGVGHFPQVKTNY
jgi:hypothetical protein